MFCTLCIPVSAASEANSKTLILMLLAPFSNKPFICKLKYFLDKSTASNVSSSFTVSRNEFILRKWRTSFTMRSTNLLYSRLISSSSTIYNTVTSLNKALSELNSWCLENSLTPDSAKCEAMLFMRKPHIGPLNSVTIGEDRIEWVKHSRLLGVTIDERLSWSRHLPDIKKNFVNKLNLLKRSSFLSRNALLDLYFKIILPSVLYGLIVWGGCPNAELLHSLEILHCRAARIIYNLPQDMPTEEVYRHSNWNSIN